MNIHGRNQGAAGDVEIETQNNFFGGNQPTLPNSIPSISGFVGREDYLADLREAYRNGTRCFALYGTGGVGKTATALQFAGEIAGEYAAKAFVEMNGMSKNPLSAREAMLDVVRQFERDIADNISDAQLEHLFLSKTQSQPTLIVLDNAADEDSVAALKETKACLIITSRRKIYLDEEPLEIAAMTDADAVKLLLDKGGKNRIGESAAAIAKECGNLPLALNVVRSLLIKQRLLRVPEFIERLKREKLAHLSEVESSFNLSYENIGAELQNRWRQLAVFPASFAADAAAAVWETDLETAERTLEELESYSLIEFFQPDDGAETRLRMRLHDLARAFTAVKLSEDERFQAQFQFAKHYASLLKAAEDMQTARQENYFLNVLKLIDAEWDNIRTGHKWSAEFFEKNDDIANLCINYSICARHFIILRVHPREDINWLKTGLQAARKLDNRQAEANSLGSLGVAYHKLGEYRKAIEFHEQSLKIKREIGDRNGEGNSLGNLGIAYYRLDELQKAIEFHEQALTISRELGDRDGESQDLGNLGIAYYRLDEYQKALELHEQALIISREIGDRDGEGRNLANMGSTYDSLGEYQKAVEYYGDALIIARETGNRFGEGSRLGNLGIAYHKLGERKKACGLWKEAVIILEAIESPSANVFRQSLEENGC